MALDTSNLATKWLGFRNMTETISGYDPGHFHAALLLVQRNPRVSQTIHVYAPTGPDVEKFITLIENFNSRTDDTTDWLLDCHNSPNATDALEAMVAERPGRIVILAGRNGDRLALMLSPPACPWR